MFWRFIPCCCKFRLVGDLQSLCWRFSVGTPFFPLMVSLLQPSFP
nr:MAG TPA: hypothetical protein [Bacteriophage sp.]